jgi:Glycosyl hydrolase family 20, domain 2
MNRRKFLERTGASLALSPWLRGQTAAHALVDLKNCRVIYPESASPREKKAAAVLVEEAAKRSGLEWRAQAGGNVTTQAVIQLATRSNVRNLAPEGYSIRVEGQQIFITGTDERGLLFGVGKLLQKIRFDRQSAAIDPQQATITTSPKYSLRGHQLGYRPKTNAYDAWTVTMWDQYIRDLAIFGTNAIELIPPRSDDLPDSPHFPLPPEQMMIEMSRIADSYGLDVWIWYPAMDPDYGNAATVESALREWAHIYQILPRIDAVFVPGGDPGHTAPGPLLAFLEKQKSSLRRFHPKAQMWVSPQSFREEWIEDFFRIVDEAHSATWLDGIVYGPQNRVDLPQLRERLPKRYPIRFYPDITHSLACQYPVPEWDVAYALTEGRECINPRPEDEANILRRYSPYTIGFLTYSEGCNDDVNKFVWSALGWDPETKVTDALRDFGRYFLGHQYADDFAQGLLRLEANWAGPIATNEGIVVTTAQFQDLERRASPAVLANWRFQQALYRAYFDGYLRSRVLAETARLARARDLLASVYEVGWTSEPLEIGGRPSPAPPNGGDPSVLLAQAEQILNEEDQQAGGALRERVNELGEALFNSIRMQLAVARYQGEAVVRGANLETLDYPITEIPWFRAQLSAIRKISAADQQVEAIKQLLARTDPGPGGFYDDLGNPANRPHLVLGLGAVVDPEYRKSALTGCGYPDRLGAQAPIAWKRWAESLFDEPLRMTYRGLDAQARYRLRVVYSGDARRIRIQLRANGTHQIHSLMERPWPPQPLEFDLPAEATEGGQLELAWTRESGLGGNGRGSQVSEVWLFKQSASSE